MRAKEKHTARKPKRRQEGSWGRTMILVDRMARKSLKEVKKPATICTEKRACLINWRKNKRPAWVEKRSIVANEDNGLNT